MRHARLVVPVVAAVVTTLGLVSSAHAGTFTVLACDAAPGSVNHSWTSFNTDPTYLETGDLCSNSGFPGLYADDIVGLSTNVPEGTEAGWIFSAPVGTAITTATVNRDLFKHDNNWLLFIRDASGALLDPGCNFNASQTNCEASGQEPLNALSTSSIAIGVHCSNNSNTVCGNGGTLHDVYAHMASATVTLTDTTSPTISSTGGSLLSGGWQSGTQGGTISASDNTGIQYLRVYVDNTLANSAAQSCDFTYAIPCQQASSVGVALNTASIADGQHQLQLAAVDPAGNETRSAATAVYFDNTPPAVPTGGHVAQQGSAGPVTIAWTNPAPDNGSPVAGVRWEACKSGAGCSAVQTQTGNLTSFAFDPTALAPFTASPQGSYTVSVWLEDAAGNTNQANAGAVDVAYGLGQTSPATATTPVTTTAAPALASPSPAPRTTITTKKPAAKRRRHCAASRRRRRPAHKAATKRVVRHRARCLATRHRSHPKR
jgi:hypothetical protein